MHEDMGEDLQQNREAHSEGWWTVNPEKAKSTPPIWMFFSYPGGHPALPEKPTEITVQTPMSAREVVF